MPQTQDWVDGFLFVGNQPALDLLNTELVSDGQTVELLPDVPALMRWFAAAGFIKAADARKAFRDPRRLRTLSPSTAGIPGSASSGRA